MSPMPLPSTSTRPALTGSARRAPASSNAEHLAVLEQERRLLRQTDGARQPQVLRQMAVLAVHRHEVARPHQVEHQRQLVRLAWPETWTSCVARGEHRERRADTCGSPCCEIGRSLPGMMREERTTASPGSICTCTVVAHRDARQRRHRLALAARREHGDALGRQRRPARRPRRRSPAGRAGSPGRWRCAGCSRGCGRRPRPDGRSPPTARSPAAGGGRATRTSRRRCAPRPLWNTLSSPLRTLRSEPVDPGCSTLVESESSSSTPRAPYSAKAWMSGAATVDRGVVDLEVAGVHDDAERRRDRQPDRVDDRVGDVDRIDRERPESPSARAAGRYAGRPCRRDRARAGATPIRPAAIGVA